MGAGMVGNVLTRLKARPSAIVLILINSVPLLGVVFLAWSVFSVVFLYWLETAIIGFYTLLKTLAVGFHSRKRNPALTLVAFAGAPFLAYFGGHFLTLVLYFLTAIFGEEYLAPDPAMGLVDNGLYILTTVWNTSLHAIVSGALFLFSHGMSFVLNFIRRREMERIDDLSDLLVVPIVRIGVLWFTLWAGGLLVLLFKMSVFGLMMLVVLKTGVDLYAHLRIHARLQKKALRPTLPAKSKSRKLKKERAN